MDTQAPSTKYWMHLNNAYYANRWGPVRSTIVSTGPRHKETWTVTIHHGGQMFTVAAPKLQDAKDQAARQVLLTMGVDLSHLRG